MKKEDIQLAALKNIKDKNGPDLGDYTRTLSADMLPFGDQIGGVLGGAGASLGRFVGGLQEGEDLSTALSEGAGAFSEGRRDSIDSIEQSREKLPESVQGASLAAGMLMPGGFSKAGKAMKVLDGASDAGKAALAAQKAKRMGKFDKVSDMISTGKKAKADELLERGPTNLGKTLRSRSPRDESFIERVAGSKYEGLDDASKDLIIESAIQRGILK